MYGSITGYILVVLDEAFRLKHIRYNQHLDSGKDFFGEFGKSGSLFVTRTCTFLRTTCKRKAYTHLENGLYGYVIAKNYARQFS